MDLVAVTDTLVEGVHFPVGSAPASIGHRALAVNLSDLAAMGAEPAWALLALTLPAGRRVLARGLRRRLRPPRPRPRRGAGRRRHHQRRAGRDVQVLGFVPAGQGLRAQAAAPATGCSSPAPPATPRRVSRSRWARKGPGGLDEAWLRDRFLYPAPRVALGQWLRALASACIDVSDGLFGDLGKLAAASGCGAEIDVTRLPLSPALIRWLGAEKALERALAAATTTNCASPSPTSASPRRRPCSPRRRRRRAASDACGQEVT